MFPQILHLSVKIIRSYALSNCFLLDVAFEPDAGELTAAVRKSPAAAEIEQENETALLHHVLDGILTIGTLGHSHPILLPSHISEEEEEAEEAPELESPGKELAAAEKPSARIAFSQPAIEMFQVKTEQPVEVFGIAEERIMAEVPLLKEDRERKERTTLADLLAAEPAATGDEPVTIAGATKNSIAVLILPTAPASAFKGRGKEKKKLKKKNKADDADSSLNSSATKRIRRMITRMVKKKIHPEAAAAVAAEPGVKGGGVAAVGADPLLLSCGGGGGGETA